jgi:nitroreductase
MSRSFAPRPVDWSLVSNAIDLALRAPSAGKTQGWHLLVLEGDDVASFWDDTLPGDRRSSFTWQELLVAPMILLPFADPQRYVDRYAEPDKQSTGLGAGVGAWPVPYWTVDTSFAVMTLLLALRDVDLGALFFGVFAGEEALRRRLGVPERLQLLGAIAVGHPTGTERRGRSASRPRRSVDDVIHRSRWRHQ